MDSIPYDVMVDGVSLIFAIAGLIWAIRFTGVLSDRHAPIAAVALGVVFVGGLQLLPAVLSPIVRGIAAGTVASGGYAGIKKMVTNSPNPAEVTAGAGPAQPPTPAPPPPELAFGLLPVDPPSPPSPTTLPPLAPPAVPPERPSHDPGLQP